MTFSRAFPVEWPCFRAKNWVPSTQYQGKGPMEGSKTRRRLSCVRRAKFIPSHVAIINASPIVFTSYPPYWCISSRSTALWICRPRRMPSGAHSQIAAVACDTMSWEGGIPACAAGARYATFIVSAYPFSHSSLGSTSSTHQMVGCKIRVYTNCPTFILYFSFRSQVLTIFCTQNLKMACKNCHMHFRSKILISERKVTPSQHAQAPVHRNQKNIFLIFCG